MEIKIIYLVIYSEVVIIFLRLLLKKELVAMTLMCYIQGVSGLSEKLTFPTEQKRKWANIFNWHFSQCERNSRRTFDKQEAVDSQIQGSNSEDICMTLKCCQLVVNKRNILD